MHLIYFFLPFLLFLGGCTTLESPPEPGDPFESFNRSMHSFNNKVDEYVLKPTAESYNTVLPIPVKKGVSNFFSNLDDVIVVFNDLFQLKFIQFLSDLGRLAINSTVGVYGLFDFSSDLGLEKHEEDFGQTLGYWGVPRGPYLVLPFFGPSTVRDGSSDFLVDREIDPVYLKVHKDAPFPNRGIDTTVSLLALDAVNTRSLFLRSERVLREALVDDDDYYFIRDAYLQRRNKLVFDGNPPLEDWEYYEE